MSATSQQPRRVPPTAASALKEEVEQYLANKGQELELEVITKQVSRTARSRLLPLLLRCRGE